MTQDNVRVNTARERVDDHVLEQFRAHSVANLGDALDRLNIVDEASPPSGTAPRPSVRRSRVLTVAGDNKAVIAALEHIRPGDMLVINAFGYDGRAIVGDNLAQRFAVHGAAGAVVDGYVRDAAIIEQLRVPVFARGLTLPAPSRTARARSAKPSPSAASWCTRATSSPPTATASSSSRHTERRKRSRPWRKSSPARPRSTPRSKSFGAPPDNRPASEGGRLPVTVADPPQVTAGHPPNTGRTRASRGKRLCHRHRGHACRRDTHTARPGRGGPHAVRDLGRVTRGSPSEIRPSEYRPVDSGWAEQRSNRPFW